MESAPITPSLTSSVDAAVELPLTSPVLMHTLNVFGELSMFVDPTKCKCPTCVEYCSKDRMQECWGCRNKFHPRDYMQKYCTEECEDEDNRRMQEGRACCSGCCCDDYNHQEFQQDCEDESSDDLDYDYPSSEEEVTYCPRCRDAFCSAECTSLSTDDD